MQCNKNNLHDVTAATHQTFRGVSIQDSSAKKQMPTKIMSKAGEFSHTLEQICKDNNQLSW
ncbi:hypothetical protein AF72_12160 [Xylella taiwanensis]|uniref:Uncharacterized protein n=1 Tax=Xylella taiwanensis TaxID=1444770 RepID=Z9JH73_9GAMM|nr:hypothetical protein AF72_12160 [Xylella taiwanensis]